MNCDAAQNRLLAAADPDRLPDAVRDHLAGCGECRRFRDRAAVLDAHLAALPVPSADGRKAVFVESLLAAGPVITAVPARPARGNRSLREVLAGFAWKPTGSVAAVALVGLGAWQFWPAPKPPVAEVPGPRAELVSRVLGYQKDLALETDTFRRMGKLTDLAADLEREARGVGLAADKDEMRALAGMFDKVVVGGVVGQAKRIDRNAKPADRQAALAATAARLAAFDTSLRAQAASPDAKESLVKMADAAQAARAELIELAKRGT